VTVLVYIPYSPWSEKARWAIAHHGVTVEKRAHLPMVGEAALRLRARRLRGRVSVPFLAADDGARLFDSLDIARWAEERGSGSPLFPAGADDEVSEWNRRSEAIMGAGRPRTSARVFADREALLEAVPAPLRRPADLGVALGRAGVHFLARKYRFDLGEAAQRAYKRTIRDELDHLRAALAASGGEYILGRFSFADIAMAAALQFVKPVESDSLRLGPATRRAWTDPAIAPDAAELLAWRDHLYERHR
jgi:glutathione S-transferase